MVHTPFCGCPQRIRPASALVPVDLWEGSARHAPLFGDKETARPRGSVPAGWHLGDWQRCLLLPIPQRVGGASIATGHVNTMGAVVAEGSATAEHRSAHRTAAPIPRCETGAKATGGVSSPATRHARACQCAHGVVLFRAPWPVDRAFPSHGGVKTPHTTPAGPPPTLPYRRQLFLCPRRWGSRTQHTPRGRHSPTVVAPKRRGVWWGGAPRGVTNPISYPYDATLPAGHSHRRGWLPACPN